MSEISRGAQKRIDDPSEEHQPKATALSFWERANSLWQQRNIRGLRMALGSALSLLFLWLAFRDVPISQVITALIQADYRFVALALALVLVSPLARAARWKLLYYPDENGLSYLRLAEVLLISQMLNIVVPARLGEVARIYFMGKIERRSRARTLGTIAVEKWLDILVLLLLVLLVPIFLSLPPWFSHSPGNPAVFAAAFLGVALTLSYGKDWLLTLLESVSRFLPGAWRARVHQATGLALGSLDVLRSPWMGLQLQGWSLLIWSLSILVNHIMFLALGLPLSFAPVLCRCPVPIGRASSGSGRALGSGQAGGLSLPMHPGFGLLRRGERGCHGLCHTAVFCRLGPARASGGFLPVVGKCSPARREPCGLEE